MQESFNRVVSICRRFLSFLFWVWSMATETWYLENVIDLKSTDFSRYSHSTPKLTAEFSFFQGQNLQIFLQRTQ